MDLSLLFLARRAVLHCAMPTVSLSCQAQQWPLITWMAFAEWVGKGDHPGPTHPFVEKLRIQHCCCETSPVIEYDPGLWAISGVYTVPALSIPMCSRPNMERERGLFISASRRSKQIVAQRSLTFAYWWLVPSLCHLQCMIVFFKDWNWAQQSKTMVSPKQLTLLWCQSLSPSR